MTLPKKDGHDGHKVAAERAQRMAESLLDTGIPGFHETEHLYLYLVMV